MAKDYGIARSIDDLIQDAGYGIANIFGQGETANKVVNWIHQLINKNYDPDKTTAQLIDIIRAKVGNKPNEISKLINKIDKVIADIDQKAGSLAPGLSQNLRNSSRKVRAELKSKRSDFLSERNSLSSDLYKVENTMNQALNQAMSQDSIAHSKKQANQKQIKELLDSSPNPDLSSIERKISDV